MVVVTDRDVSPIFKEHPKPKARRKPINPISAHKAERDKVLAESVRQVVERSQGRCELPGPHAAGCNGRGQECHHITPRSLGGGHEAGNLAYLSRVCHELAESVNSEMFGEEHLF